MGGNNFGDKAADEIATVLSCYENLCLINKNFKIVRSIKAMKNLQNSAFLIEFNWNVLVYRF